ncbi:XRE family transcriptional regulator [Catenulispora yoronensis]|uniref:XRE family transcriptional regulator n=1 Tax=Catenulispora yoronensis TaxID=450799 RepID=UPI0031D102FF
MKRRTLLAAAAGGLAAAQTDLLAAIRPAPPPASVSTENIKEVRQAAEWFTGLDHTYGGVLVRESLLAHLRSSVQLLNAKCPPRLKPDLLSAVGYLGGVGGAMAFDAFVHDEGEQMFKFSRSCAEEAGDWHLYAKMSSWLGRQAIWRGDPAAGLGYIDLGLRRAEWLTATEQAMLYTARARGYAKQGLVRETLEAVDAADNAFSKASPTEDPPWMAYYDSAQHHGDTGHALFDLAVKHRAPFHAAERLHTAVQGHTDSYARSRAISRTKLATLTMVTGDPAEAANIGTTAIREAGRIKSRRAAADLRELKVAAGPHATMPAIQKLRDRVEALVGSA